jgi:putative membrane protein
MDGGMMGAMGIWMFLVVITVVAVLVAAVLGSIWLVRRLREDGRDPVFPGEDDGTHEELRRRYAAGEIDDEEYERRLAVLNR